jgi:hypothetical protein
VRRRAHKRRRIATRTENARRHCAVIDKLSLATIDAAEEFFAAVGPGLVEKIETVGAAEQWNPPDVPATAFLSASRAVGAVKRAAADARGLFPADVACSVIARLTALALAAFLKILRARLESLALVAVDGISVDERAARTGELLGTLQCIVVTALEVPRLWSATVEKAISSHVPESSHDRCRAILLALGDAEGDDDGRELLLDAVEDVAYTGAQAALAATVRAAIGECVVDVGAEASGGGQQVGGASSDAAHAAGLLRALAHGIFGAAVGTRPTLGSGSEVEAAQISVMTLVSVVEELLSEGIALLAARSGRGVSPAAASRLAADIAHLEQALETAVPSRFSSCARFSALAGTVNVLALLRDADPDNAVAIFTGIDAGIFRGAAASASMRSERLERLLRLSWFSTHERSAVLTAFALQSAPPTPVGGGGMQ